MKWIKIEDEKPKPFIDILFSDGKYIYLGWPEIEIYNTDEILSFFYYDGRTPQWLSNITHWMHLPKLPEK